MNILITFNSLLSITFIMSFDDKAIFYHKKTQFYFQIFSQRPFRVQTVTVHVCTRHCGRKSVPQCYNIRQHIMNNPKKQNKIYCFSISIPVPFDYCFKYMHRMRTVYKGKVFESISCILMPKEISDLSYDHFFPAGNQFPINRGSFHGWSVQCSKQKNNISSHS